eukprot:CAMPEP_0114626852 /NCGR_PEP_ID=MMETSP0168-20121206/11996_1 /TAXON_ID=95228 ORGANISM="Vannella sp., Strain DIVA3 517/6/12" /NCGR_SAMPLE_ID=MMETSP0168 /ASSEMBLY_ACC=CAM_ASM_000044 /LENGTH=257 /DNA_ID=CAMNT_0001838171 /DNA_START=1 /DNA_END=771 /DNA_ORIENTATION=+
MSYAETTALFIAKERALETAREDALFKDPYAEHLGGMCGQNLSDKVKSHAEAFGFGDWTGFHEQWTAVRTAYIDNWLNKAIEAHGDNASSLQVVNLGAGVCTRPYRLQSLGKVAAVFQVDLEAMTNFRKKVLATIDGLTAIPQTIHDLVCDLSTDALPGVLEEAGFRRDKPTLWVLEGLVMYLAKDRQIALLKQLGELSCAGSGAVVNYMADDGTGRNPAAHPVDELTQLFKESSWSSVNTLMFGEEELDFGRYKAS